MRMMGTKRIRMGIVDALLRSEPSSAHLPGNAGQSRRGLAIIDRHCNGARNMIPTLYRIYDYMP